MVPQELQTTGRQAYELALYLTGSPQEAWSIVEDAFLLVFLTEGNLVQRESSTPRKTVFTQAEHLVQYFVMDFFERRQMTTEQDSRPNPLQIKRYINYLLVLTMPHTAFHVGVAVMRLLFSYSNREALGVHENQIPHATKDENECSRAKSRWFKALEHHFSGQLRPVTGAKGEKRFEVMANASQWRDFVNEVLTRLAPWQAEQLTAHSELALIHELIEPQAFRTLVAKALCRQEPPALRLPEMGGDMGGDDEDQSTGGSPDLENGMKTFLQRLNTLRGLKKKQPPRAFVLKLDGVVCARIAPLGQVSLPLDPWARVFELWTESSGTAIPLAYSLLPMAGSAEPFRETIRLESGRLLTLSLQGDTPNQLKVALEATPDQAPTTNTKPAWWRRRLGLPMWAPLLGFATLLLAVLIMPRPQPTAPRRSLDPTTAPHYQPHPNMETHNAALAEVLLERAQALAEAGDRQAALADLEAARRLAPRHLKVLALLSRYLEETGELEKSRFYDEIRRQLEQE